MVRLKTAANHCAALKALKALKAPTEVARSLAQRCASTIEALFFSVFKSFSLWEAASDTIFPDSIR